MGIGLELASVGWMAIEATVAITAGVLARSVVLTAFGFDSVVELISAVTLTWRLASEAAGQGIGTVVIAERRATKVSTVLLTVLCVYVLVTSVGGLVVRLHPVASTAGLVVAAAALVIMPLLAWGKRTANRTLQSAALRADIAESVACAYMAAVTLIGVGLDALGWWWADYLAAMVLLLLLAREAREAFAATRG